jgi:hydrogenase expression/formation protein HypD
MKFVHEYRDSQLVQRLAEELARCTTKPWTLMEVCGGQTHAIVRFGLDSLMPKAIALVHGPGCPVCVTPIELIDKAIRIASQPDVIFCSFGDMLRVPGSGGDLLAVKAGGGDVRVLYSPLDAVKLAQKNPEKEVVFFAVGFETTAPAHALAVIQAHRQRVRNFSLLVSHVLVPPAMEAILSSPLNRVQGFLAAGHVCAVMGCLEYEAIARRYSVPIVVTGFEPVDILRGILSCVRQLETGRAEVQNEYARTVRADGNASAKLVMGEVFQVVDRKWRGIGEIPRSGLGLAPAYACFDAEQRFAVETVRTEDSSECISGLVLQGIKKPHECPAFACRCSPERPFGATMVSSEGACAAYYRYRTIPASAAVAK